MTARGTDTERETILETLRQVRVANQNAAECFDGCARDPESGTWIVTLCVDPAQGGAIEELRQAAERALSGQGFAPVRVLMTAASDPASNPAAKTEARNRNTGSRPAKGYSPAGVEAILAVASGKGGVGKSTVAANLAAALAREGLRTGLMDADIYGPSVPRLFGLEAGKQPERTESSRLIPPVAYDVAVMSMGFLVGEDVPMIWRGPMVQTAIRQFLQDVDWTYPFGGLDVLIVDMPPGTGDAQLTMAQKVPMDGAVIVSTPQDLALIDARKGLAMFRKVDVPILGIVENMSYFLCPHCGERSEIFGHGGAESAAGDADAPFLGAIPLDGRIRALSDSGQLPAATEPDSNQGRALRDVALNVLAALEESRTSLKPPPEITIGA